MSSTITFLGTGAADTVQYFQTCFVVSNGNGEDLLVDTGGGSDLLRQLSRANIPLENIRHLFITHKHLDHFWGLFWILRFLGSRIAKGKAKDLHIYTSNAIIGIIKKMSPLFIKEKVINLYNKDILFHPINEEKEIFINDWILRPMNIHSVKEEQFGFVFSYDTGKKLVFSGDEPLRDELRGSAKNVQYLIHNAFCLERDREFYRPHEIHHSTVKDACEIAQENNVENLILVHTEDKTFGERKKLYTDEAKAYYDGNIVVPDDLERVEL